jgi:hypothetical protein
MRRIRFNGSRSPSNLGDPAVDEDLAPRHEAALVGRQERDDLRHLVTTTGSREGGDGGGVVEEAAKLVLRDARLPVAGRFNYPGAHGIDADISTLQIR